MTSIIDWQSTSIKPAFIYANETPDLAEDPATDIPILEKLRSSPEDGASNEAAAQKPVALSPEEEAEKEKHEKDVWTCRQTFEVILKAYIPKLHNARAMDETILRPFRFCNSSWRDGATAL